MGNLNLNTVTVTGTAAFHAVVRAASKTKLQLKRSSVYDCPHCKERLLPPIYQCFNGHTLCGHCEDLHPTCPKCEDDLPKIIKIRNRLLEELVMELKFDCKNRNQGCLASLKYSEIEDHNWDCQFTKLYICFHLGIDCNEEQTLRTILTHLNGHNLQEIIFHDQKSKKGENFESCPIEISQSVLYSKLGQAYEETWKPIFIRFKGHIFFLTTKYEVETQSFTWAVFNFGSGQLSKQFVTRIKIIPKNSEINSLEWQGPVAELKDECHYANNRNRNQKSSLAKFNVSLDILKQLCEQEPKLTVCGDAQSYVEDSDELGWRIHLKLAQRKYEEVEFGWDAQECGVVLESITSY